jgi:hypothetical protein
MKTFSDLVFKEHPNMPGLQAVMFFANGYGVSVVRFKSSSGGYGSYTDNELEWEVAVLRGSEKDYSLTYETPITDDVIGHLSDSKVTDIMLKVQALKKLEEMEKG